MSNGGLKFKSYGYAGLDANSLVPIDTLPNATNGSRGVVFGNNTLSLNADTTLTQADIKSMALLSIVNTAVTSIVITLGSADTFTSTAYGNTTTQFIMNANSGVTFMRTGTNDIAIVGIATYMSGGSGLPSLANGKFWLGNSSNVATAVTMTGNVTMDNTGATTIANNAVDNIKLAQMPTMTLKGNNTGNTANATDLTATQATAMLNPAQPNLNGTVNPDGNTIAEVINGYSVVNSNLASLVGINYAITYTQSSTQYYAFTSGSNLYIYSWSGTNWVILTTLTVTSGTAQQLLYYVIGGVSYITVSCSTSNNLETYQYTTGTWNLLQSTTVTFGAPSYLSTFSTNSNANNYLIVSVNSQVKAYTYYFTSGTGWTIFATNNFLTSTSGIASYNWTYKDVNNNVTGYVVGGSLSYNSSSWNDATGWTYLGGQFPVGLVSGYVTPVTIGGGYYLINRTSNSIQIMTYINGTVTISSTTSIGISSVNQFSQFVTINNTIYLILSNSTTIATMVWDGAKFVTQSTRAVTNTNINANSLIAFNYNNTLKVVYYGTTGQTIYSLSPTYSGQLFAPNGTSFAGLLLNSGNNSIPNTSQLINAGAFSSGKGTAFIAGINGKLTTGTISLSGTTNTFTNGLSLNGNSITLLQNRTYLVSGSLHVITAGGTTTAITITAPNCSVATQTINVPASQNNYIPINAIVKSQNNRGQLNLSLTCVISGTVTLTNDSYFLITEL